MALHGLLVFQDWLQELVADRDLRLTLVTLWSGQAKGQISPALWTVIAMVLLHISILSTLAKGLGLFQLLTIFFVQSGCGTLALIAVLSPETYNLREGRVVLNRSILFESKPEKVSTHGIRQLQQDEHVCHRSYLTFQVILLVGAFCSSQLAFNHTDMNCNIACEPHHDTLSYLILHDQLFFIALYCLGLLFALIESLLNQICCQMQLCLANQNFNSIHHLVKTLLFFDHWRFRQHLLQLEGRGRR